MLLPFVIIVLFSTILFLSLDFKLIYNKKQKFLFSFFKAAPHFIFSYPTLLSIYLDHTINQ